MFVKQHHLLAGAAERGRLFQVGDLAPTIARGTIMDQELDEYHHLVGGFKHSEKYESQLG